VGEIGEVAGLRLERVETLFDVAAVDLDSGKAGVGVVDALVGEPRPPVPVAGVCGVMVGLPQGWR
jgi:hypothetical protein